MKQSTFTVGGSAGPVVVNFNESTIEAGVTTNMEVPEEYLPGGVEVVEAEDGNFVVVEKINTVSGDNVVKFVIIELISLIVTGFAINKLRKNV